MATAASTSPDRGRASASARSRRSLSPRSRQHDASSSRNRHRSRSPERESGPDSSAHTEPKATSEPGKLHEEPPLPDEAVPPLPDEAAPPLPNEPVPAQASAPQDDGWEPAWDANAQAYYFYNRFTQVSQWENPRVSESSEPVKPAPARTGAAGGYNPAIHGDYDPNADYAIRDDEYEAQPAADEGDQLEGEADYSASASFNRFTGSFNNTSLHPTHTPDAHTADAKAYRQMQSHFDVDATAAQYDGRSLKEERQQRKLSKKELKAFRDKKKARQEEKQRAWLRG